MSAADVEDVEVGGEALQALQVGARRRRRREQERTKMRENKELGINVLVIITSFNLTVFHFLKPTSSAGCVKKSQSKNFSSPANSNSSPASILIVARLILIVGQPIVSHPPVQAEATWTLIALQNYQIKMLFFEPFTQSLI